MNIFIDSNIIIEDFDLKKADSILFLNNYHREEFNCFISEVTYREIITNFRKHLVEKKDRFNSATNKINRQINGVLPILDNDFINLEVEKYEEQLKNKLSNYKIKIAPLPKVRHSEILEHLFSKKHPFDNSDAGYKDFLIFQTILENISKYNKNIMLISKDSDFGDSAIHKDLADLNKSSYEITLRKSFKDLNNVELKYAINAENAKLEFIIDLFNEESHSSEYLNSIADYLNTNIINIPASFLLDYTDFIIDEPILIEIYVQENSGKMNSVNAINENLLIVDLYLEAYLIFDFSIKQADATKFKNWDEDYYNFNFYDDNNKIGIRLGTWQNIRVKVQSDKNGMEIKNIEAEIFEHNYH